MNGFDIRSIEFRQFLVAANLAGYATAGEGGERIRTIAERSFASPTVAARTATGILASIPLPARKSFGTGGTRYGS